MQNQNEIPVPTIEGFIEFLTSQPEDKIVGYTGNASNCPFLNYLKTLSQHFITVVGTYYKFKDIKQGIEMKVESEVWIREFVRTNDRKKPFGLEPVTAREALETLNKVIEEIS